MHRQGAKRQTKLVEDFELNDLDASAILASSTKFMGVSQRLISLWLTIPISSTLGITKLQETITKKRIKFQCQKFLILNFYY